MENSVETVEIDVKHSSQRHITAQGDAMKICFKQNSNENNMNEVVRNKKQVRIAEDGSQNITISYENPKQRSPSYENPKQRSPSYEYPKPRSPSYEYAKPRSPSYEYSKPRSPSYDYDYPKPKSPSYENSKPKSPDGIKICQFYKKYGRCKFENECYFLHEKSPVEPLEKSDQYIDRHIPERSDGGHTVNAPDRRPTHSRETNGDNSYLNINTSNTRTCKFFMQKKGCKYGDNCPFTHYRSVGDAGADVLNNIPEKMRNISFQEQTDEFDQINVDESRMRNKKKQSPRKCLFFIKDGVCRKGEQCDFSHVLKNEEKRMVLSPMDTEAKQPNTDLKERSNSTNSRNQKKCYYFKRNGCRLKEACPFIHEQSENIKFNKGKVNGKNEVNFKDDNMEERDKQLNESMEEEEEKEAEEYNEQSYEQSYERTLNDTSHVSIKKTNQYCTFFLTPKGCFRGDKCAYLHPMGDTDNLGGDDYQALQETEYRQLEKRFSADDKYKLLQSEPSTIYSVTFEPSDPDWGIVVKEFVLFVEFPADYPKEMFNISLEDNEIYPEGFTSFMNEGIQGWIKERQQDRGESDLAFRPFLKWFDRNVEDLVLDAGRKVKQLRDAQEAGITLIPHDSILQNTSMELTGSQELTESQDDSSYDVEPSCNINTNGNGNHSDDIDVNEMLQDDSTRMLNANAKASTRVKMGTELKFSHLEVNENVASMTLKNLLLIVQCMRCKSRTEFNLQAKKKVSSSCKKCRVSQNATFHPEIVHQYSHIAGYLHLDGCKAADAVLLDSTVIINCLNCSKDNTKKGIAYGKKGDYWCEFCHTKMEIQIATYKFTQLQKNGEKLQEVKVVNKKAVKYPGIKEGSPLPDNGTCKHYKKSYRWLRFPCCGKVYPCDVCHEEGEENDHEMKFATRMVCGFCSKEQPFAKDKPCVACKTNVTKSKSSHWEGGKGCRNRTTMDRNDSRKTAGIGKTISRKKAAET